MKFINPENIRNISFYVQRDYSAIDSLQTFSLCLFSVMGRWLSDDENFFHLQNISHFSMIFTIKFDKTSFEMWGPPVNQIYLVTLRPTHLAHLSFFLKNQMLQNLFLISVMLRWHSGVENHEIWTFKVNFLYQKTSESF